MAKEVKTVIFDVGDVLSLGKQHSPKKPEGLGIKTPLFENNKQLFKHPKWKKLFEDKNE